MKNKLWCLRMMLLLCTFPLHPIRFTPRFAFTLLYVAHQIESFAGKSTVHDKSCCDITSSQFFVVNALLNVMWTLEWGKSIKRKINNIWANMNTVWTWGGPMCIWLLLWHGWGMMLRNGPLEHFALRWKSWKSSLLKLWSMLSVGLKPTS